MPSPYDVIVVGSGPAGGTAARYAARRGLKVLLVDKRKEIGVPVQCGEYVAHNEEMRSIFPDVEGLEDLMSVPYHVREVDTPVIRIWSPKGRRYEVPFFFFSSRRRHTRWTGDWSSDVCSSDLDHQFEIRVERCFRRVSLTDGLHLAGSASKPVAILHELAAILEEFEAQRIGLSQEIRGGGNCVVKHRGAIMQVRDAIAHVFAIPFAAVAYPTIVKFINRRHVEVCGKVQVNQAWQ